MEKNRKKKNAYTGIIQSLGCKADTNATLQHCQSTTLQQNELILKAIQYVSETTQISILDFKMANVYCKSHLLSQLSWLLNLFPTHS